MLLMTPMVHSSIIHYPCITAQKQKLVSAAIRSSPASESAMTTADFAGDENNISNIVVRSRLRLIRLLQTSQLYKFDEVLYKLAEVGYLKPEESIVHGKVRLDSTDQFVDTRR